MTYNDACLMAPARVMMITVMLYKVTSYVIMLLCNL